MVAESLAKDRVLVSQLSVACDALEEIEDQEKVFTWKEQHLLRTEICEKISSKLFSLKDDVVGVLALVSGFVVQIPCHYLLEDGTYVELEKVQAEFEKLIFDSLEGEPRAPKLENVSVIAASLRKATEECKDGVHTITESGRELKKQTVIFSSIKVPDDREIDEFLVEVLDRVDME